MTIEVTTLTCKQCGHTWRPRKSKIYECPRCQSPRWDEAKENDGEA